jgi:hypothetical protein
MSSDEKYSKIPTKQKFDANTILIKKLKCLGDN